MRATSAEFTQRLLPLLIDKTGGLLVEVTDGTADYNTSRYRLSVFYDLAKVAVNRLAFSQGHELEPHGATAVAMTPGWLRSEMMLDNWGVAEEADAALVKDAIDSSIGHLLPWMPWVEHEPRDSPPRASSSKRSRLPGRGAATRHGLPAPTRRACSRWSSSGTCESKTREI